MLSRSLRSRLFLVTTVAGLGSLGWEGYGPHGYRYEFRVHSRTVDEYDLPDQQQWEGYAVEWRGRVPFVTPQGEAAVLTRTGRMPVRGDAAPRGRTIEFHTHPATKDLGLSDVDGIPARRYLLTADETLFVRTGSGARRRVLRTARTETEVWVSERLRGVGREFLYLADSIALLAAGRTPRVVGSLHAASAPPAFAGMPLKLVSTVVVFDSLGKRRETVTTGQVATLSRGWVDAEEIGSLRAAAGPGAEGRVRWREVAEGRR